MEVLNEQAREKTFTRVKTVHLDIGMMAYVEPDALEFHFSLLSRGSVAENAMLKISHLPGKAWCSFCQQEVDVKSYLDSCSKCTQTLSQFHGGDDLLIRNLEVE